MTEKDYNLCVKNYSDGVLRFVNRSILSTEDAKDILQDSLIKLWANIQNVSVEKSKSFLFTTAHNLMINKLKAKKVRQDFQTSQQKETPIAQANNTKYEQKDLILYAVNQLPLNQKECLLLKDWEGFSIEEIAACLKITSSNVKVNIFRARIKIRELIDKETRR